MTLGVNMSAALAFLRATTDGFTMLTTPPLSVTSTCLDAMTKMAAPLLARTCGTTLVRPPMAPIYQSGETKASIPASSGKNRCFFILLSGDW